MTRFDLFALVMTAPLAVLAAPVAAQTAPEIAGEWHGTIAGATGDTTLVLYVTRGEGGALTAGIESRDVAPGRRAPVTEVAVANGHLTFRIPALDAVYEGAWDEAAQRWRGALLRGQRQPLDFAKGQPPVKPLIDGLDGRWEGEFEANGTRLRQVLRFESGEWGTYALYDSPDQYVTNVPVTGLARDGRAVRFSLFRGAAMFDGVLSEDGGTLTGSLKAPGQPDGAGQVTFTRTRATAAQAPPARPQNPVGPLPYKAEEVAFDNPAAPGVRLQGTLTLPPGPGPFPVAIMISGSGQHDRDETLDGHKPFWVIADHLTRNGIAVLRFDDRGAGLSTGDAAAATPGAKASDANAAFAFLAGRPEIRRDAIGFIGHSEGGLIGPVAMAANDEAAFLVSLAGPADDPLASALAQLALLLPSEGVRPEAVPAFQAAFAAIFNSMRGTATPAAGRAAAAAALTPELKAAMGIPPDNDAAALLNRWAAPRVWYLAQHDSAATLARIDAPVLALNGSLDLQVAPEQNLAAFREGLAHNRDVTVVELPGINHMFQTAKTGGRGEYRDIEETIAPAVLTLISDWINQRFRKP
jgi:alpha-beta hydrolase superfamily lysophospholipase